MTAECHVSRGDFVPADPLLVRALTAMTASSEPNMQGINHSQNLLSEVYLATGRAARAERLQLHGFAEGVPGP
jgi:hypothetical protein